MHIHLNHFFLFKFFAIIFNIYFCSVRIYFLSVFNMFCKSIMFIYLFISYFFRFNT